MGKLATGLLQAQGQALHESIRMVAEEGEVADSRSHLEGVVGHSREVCGRVNICFEQFGSLLSYG
jgi:hypothetical protein